MFINGIGGKNKMRINKEDLELLKRIGLKDFEEKELLIKLIEKIEENSKIHKEKDRIKKNEKRKENKMYGRSKKEKQAYYHLHNIGYINGNENM